MCQFYNRTKFVCIRPEIKAHGAFEISQKEMVTIIRPFFSNKKTVIFQVIKLPLLLAKFQRLRVPGRVHTNLVRM